MEIQRTIRIRLRPEPVTATVLDQTITAYTWSFNAVASHGWQAGIVNGVELHKATYYAHRAQTGLAAQLTCAARVKATEALKSAKALAKKGKTVRCPRSKACPVRYDARSYSTGASISCRGSSSTRRLPMASPSAMSILGIPVGNARPVGISPGATGRSKQRSSAGRAATWPMPTRTPR